MTLFVSKNLFWIAVYHTSITFSVYFPGIQIFTFVCMPCFTLLDVSVFIGFLCYQFVYMKYLFLLFCVQDLG